MKITIIDVLRQAAATFESPNVQTCHYGLNKEQARILIWIDGPYMGASANKAPYMAVKAPTVGLLPLMILEITKRLGRKRLQSNLYE